MNLAYAAGALGIALGLLLLGLAARRERALPGAWSSVPLGVGVVWFPLEALTAFAPDGWGLIAGGVTWMLAAFAISSMSADGRATPRLAMAGGLLWIVSWSENGFTDEGSRLLIPYGWGVMIVGHLLACRARPHRDRPATDRAARVLLAAGTVAFAIPIFQITVGSAGSYGERRC